MKRALTLNEQQYRYAINFCNTRKHTGRDQTIIHISFLAGLRAIEIAALCVGDVYDERGRARAQFTITQSLDLSRSRAAPSARLGHLSFESDRAFPAQC